MSEKHYPEGHSAAHQAPEMSSSTRKMLDKVRRIVPPMLESFHKGQLGRVAVIGGSLDYTGAPYFSAMASARLGCDLSHVICEPSAAATIKSYSPNLMVHPYLRSSKSSSTPNPTPQDLASPILDMLPRLHSLVIGPGLGRDPVTQAQVSQIIKAARDSKPPVSMVIDADGLMLINENPDLIKGHKECVLTPNVVEFSRLAKALGVDPEQGKPEEAASRLSQKLDGVCIIQKGPVDYIAAGSTPTVCDLKGGLKRSGGQGDTLTGSLGTFFAWREAYHEELWEDKEGRMSREETLLLVAFGGSAITRECSRRAFEKKGRSLQASDLTDEVHESFLALLGEKDVEKEKSNL
ncbi:MAG: hypothetical protein Q9227_003679 [Pyrenula ochraceoflavens]